MGVSCSVTVVGGNGFDLARRALERVAHLERLWTRFSDRSDISRLNNSAGTSVFVDPLTVHLIEVMKAAHTATEGIFDPTRLDAQVAAGDAESRDGSGLTVLPAGPHSHDLADIEIVDDFCVRMHHGITVDAGGIGKGLAADLVATEIIRAGASGVCVNLGGDMRCAGTPPDSHGWTVGISSPFDYDRTISTVRILDGAVATSSTSARSTKGRFTASHIMDPSTGMPSQVATVGATVIASSAAWAEAFTKVAILHPRGVDTAAAHGLACMTVDENGTVETNALWGDFAS